MSGDDWNGGIYRVDSSSRLGVEELNIGGAGEQDLRATREVVVGIGEWR
jgi:hypothetical protein